MATTPPNTPTDTTATSPEESPVFVSSLDGLSQVSRSAGLTPVDENDYVLPGIDTRLPNREFCRTVAAALPPNSLFRIENEVLTISLINVVDRNGKPAKKLDQRTMTAARLITWLENFMCFRVKRDGNWVTESIGKNRAEMLLASDEFRAIICPVKEICPVRLPRMVCDDKGNRSVTLMPAGYDPISQIYTAPEVEFIENAPLKPALDTLASCLAEFPWFEDQNFQTNRSIMVAVAAMLGQFCRHMIDRHPMIICMGNQPGTGKTLLAALLFAVIHGKSDVTPFPKGDDEALRKMLNSYLLAANPYVFLDDIPTLNSSTINQFATSRVISDRYLGSNLKFTVENRMQIFATGNNLTTTPDIERRSLFCDLFSSTLATERPIKKPMTQTSIIDPAFRADMLACLWALVRHWSDKGCPTTTKGLAMPSFEGFAEVVGSIMDASNLSSPFQKRTRTDGADEQGKALEYVLANVAVNIEGDTASYPVAHFVDAAVTLGKIDIICPGAKDTGKSLGQKLRRYKGRQFKDLSGRTFAFGKKEEAAGSVYTIYILSKDTPAPPLD